MVRTGRARRVRAMRRKEVRGLPHLRIEMWGTRRFLDGCAAGS